MQSFTVSAVADSHKMEFIVFIYAVVAVPALTILFIYSYMNKFANDPDFVAAQDPTSKVEVKLEDCVLSDI